MKKRKILILVLTMGLILCGISIVQAQNQITIVVNGRTISSDTPPQIINDRTMVPYG